jgi:hypothetical protein
MLLISRRLYPIVVRLMYSRPEFQFIKVTCFCNFLTSLRPSTLQLIRNVTVDPNSIDDTSDSDDDTPPMNGQTEELEIRKWVDYLALLPIELRRLEVNLNGGDPGLAFFTQRGTHPLLLHALRRLSKLEELAIESLSCACKLHLTFSFTLLYISTSTILHFRPIYSNPCFHRFGGFKFGNLLLKILHI